MSLTFVRAGGTLDKANASPWTMTVPAAGHAAGNAVVVCVSGGTNPVSVVVTDAKGNVYTNWELFWDAGNFSWILIAVSIIANALVSGDLITITPATGSDMNGWSGEYNATNGILTEPFLHTHNSNTHVTDWFPGALTPRKSNSVAIAAVANDANANTSTPVAPWTERRDALAASGFRGLVVEDLIQSVIGAIGAASSVGTWSAADDGPAAIVVLTENPDPSIVTVPDLSQNPKQQFLVAA